MLTVRARGKNASSLTPDIRVSLSIGNHDGAGWDYPIVLARNKAGTAYKY